MSGETFTLFTTVWDVDKAIEIAGDGREPVMAPTTAWDSIYQWIAIDSDHAKTVDLSKPLIVVMRTFDGEAMGILIDGWHRLHRAKQEGVSELPALILTEAEEAMVRLT